MAKAKKPAPKSKPVKVEDLDLDPHAWPKFEKLIKSVAKSGLKRPKADG